MNEAVDVMVITSTSEQPMVTPVAPTAVAEPGTVNRRSSKPEAWEWPLLADLGELLRSARVAGGTSWPDLEAVAGSGGSLRRIEAGTTRTRVSRLRPSQGTCCSCGDHRPADRYCCAPCAAATVHALAGAAGASASGAHVMASPVTRPCRGWATGSLLVHRPTPAVGDASTAIAAITSASDSVAA